MIVQQLNSAAEKGPSFVGPSTREHYEAAEPWHAFAKSLPRVARDSMIERRKI